MTLERIGATELLRRHLTDLHGLVLELGVGDDPYRELFSLPPISIDIDLSQRPTVVADAHLLPFRKGVFDSVLASQVFEHLHSPWIAVEELHRVTRDGPGSIVVTVPFLFPLHQEPHDYYRYTEHALTRLFGKHFQDVHTIAYGGRFAAAADILFTPTPSSTVLRRGIRKVRKSVFGNRPGRHRLLARILLLRPAGQHPVGHLVVCRRSHVV